ncbi:DsbA family oxidoreductase [Bordetella genomosp. 4]|uniref:Disulfide bond formation protein DsbA n=1 Tax=Bordetella genomosp. 4 TaxID=463044 RepID=A0A261U5K5_9BORD|nr:DsbA family oxidoreductase [Bordetella genomosp. 4]OZI48837.1 disulfide bond formation protein DsbA [Bordetella genomosp. 4]OZI56895.1 disulfide bond formation protein DsbA [Bordetella genomosp. 4]
MSKKIKIDFVSDVACPWCAVGLGGLLTAIDRIGSEAQFEIHMQPFELNPDMPKGGQNTGERLMKKYGFDQARLQENRKVIAERAAAVGMPMHQTEESRSYNTFGAHRLLHWAGTLGQEQQVALKRQLLKVYHFDNYDTSETDVLVQAAQDVGLDADAARDVVESGRYTDEVRAEQAKWRELGITSVPSVIINDKYLVSGGQPPEAFEQALRQVASET